MSEYSFNCWFKMVENGKVCIHFKHIKYLVYGLGDMYFIRKDGIIFVCLCLSNPIIVYQIWQQHWTRCFEFVDSFL